MPRLSSRKIYLGDSVYADYDGHYIRLTTENGCGPTNEIFLEPTVYDALVVYADHWRGESNGNRNKSSKEEINEETPNQSNIDGGDPQSPEVCGCAVGDEDSGISE